MNWFKAKTILIILFFCINIFLLTNMVISTNKAINVDDKTITDTVEVLFKNGININKDLIPQKTGKFFMLKVENSFKNIDVIINKVFKDKDYSIMKKEGTYIYSNNDEKLIIKGSYFEYIKSINTNTFANEEMIKDYIDNLFKNLGINNKFLKLHSMKKNENGYTALYKYSYKNKSIFDADIKVIINENIFIQGYGINPLKLSQENYPAIHMTSKLITFMSLEEVDKKTPITITNIELGYLTGEGSLKKEFKDMVIMPVWKITTNSNNTYYYDAIKGN